MERDDEIAMEKELKDTDELKRARESQEDQVEPVAAHSQYNEICLADWFPQVL